MDGSSSNLYCVEKHGSRPHSSYRVSNTEIDDIFQNAGTIRRDGGTGSNNLCRSRYNSNGKKFTRTIQTNWDFSQTQV